MKGRRFTQQAQKLDEILSLLELAVKRHDQNEQSRKTLFAAIETWRKRELEENFDIWPKTIRKKPKPGSSSTRTSSSNTGPSSVK